MAFQKPIHNEREFGDAIVFPGPVRVDGGKTQA